MIERKYDGLPTIEPDSAAQKIGDPSVYFFDTREDEEYNVSRIPKAIQLGYDNVKWSIIDTLDKNSEIIIYCSIGVRSQDIGIKLTEKGFKNVNNLYGGIFLWADQNRILHDSYENEVNVVHGYNKYWGRWIKNAKTVYE